VPPGERSLGADIEGITWNPKFRELRLSVTNSSSDTYRGLDVSIYPDNLIYSAALVGGHGDCSLEPSGVAVISYVDHPKTSTHATFTAIRSGESTSVYDSEGNIWKPLAYGGGFRLSCGSVKPKYTINMVFALVAADPARMGTTLITPPPAAI
jgi:hypothetical protein